MRSTGPILAIGGITLGNSVILNNQEFDPRVPLATGLAALAFGLIEKVSETFAVGLAWIALVTTLFVRIKPNVPSPIETLGAWWAKGGK